MRVLVCGSRDWTDTKVIYDCLDGLRKQRGIDVVIEGDARGIDRIAGLWAQKRGIGNLKFPANWEEYGKSAGPMRNKKMLDLGNPDLVIAFLGGRGTENMMALAQERNLPVLTPRFYAEDEPHCVCCPAMNAGS